MSKIETLRQLPNGAASAVTQMRQLEETLAHFDQTLAIAINRIQDQQDSMAADLMPLVELRTHIEAALAGAFKTIKSTTDAAKETRVALSDTLNGLQAQVRSLETAAQNAKPNVLKSSLAAGLSSAVLTAALLAWWLPSPETPSVTIDTQVLSQQIIQQWIQWQQTRRP